MPAGQPLASDEKIRAATDELIYQRGRFHALSEVLASCDSGTVSRLRSDAYGAVLDASREIGRRMRELSEQPPAPPAAPEPPGRRHWFWLRSA